MAAIDFYQIPASPYCRAVVMTAEKLGIELNHILLDLFAGEHRKPEFVKINPQQVVPTINDDGFILWDSHAIMTYLVNKYAPESELYPKDPQRRAIVDRMFYFDIGSLSPAQGAVIYPMFYLKKDVEPEKMETYQQKLKLFDEMLQTTPYAAGDHLTLADYSLISNISVPDVLGISLKEFPRITAWLNRLKQEIPNYEKINDIPLQQMKEKLADGRNPYI